MEKEKLVFGSQPVLGKMQSYLAAEMSILKGIIKTERLKGRSQEIMAMIASLLGTGNAILLLSKDSQRYYNECVMLARGFFERISNVCYLLSCSEDVFEECMHHAVFRQYIKREKSEKVVKDENGSILMRISSAQRGAEDLKKNGNIRKAVDKFIKSKRSRFPIPKIEKRLGFLAQQCECLNISLFLAYQQAYYDDVSEALHGSLYGSLFHVLNLGSRKRRKVEGETTKNITLLLWQTGELFNQLVILLHHENNLKDFFEKSLHNSKTTLNIVKSSLKEN